MNILDSLGDLAGLPGVAGKVQRERVRAYESQLRKGAADALALGTQLLALFEQLPSAMLASERQEYERLVERHGKEHPRVVAQRGALLGLEGMEATAASGRARTTRVLESMQMPGESFFGFVDDAAGKPLAGLTVRLVGQSRERSEATTGADGFFRITIVADTPPAAGVRKRRVRKTEESSEPEGGKPGKSTAASVEILDEQGGVLHRDAIPVQVEAGSVFREYRLSL